MNIYSPELHIAHQSRRDKLRIHQDFYVNNFPQDVSNSRNGSICYDPSELSSDQMINFSAMEPDKITPSSDAHYFTSWKGIATDSIYNSYPISALDGASSLYQNELQGLEFASLPLLPEQLRMKNQSGSISDGCGQWRGEVNLREHSITQALSLSLSSVPPLKVRDIQTNVQDSTAWRPELVSPNQNMSTGSRVLGTHRNPGPLGPFTGYATILRNSRFLRPAQQMLEEFCSISGPKDVEICDVSDGIFDEARVFGEGATNNDSRDTSWEAKGMSSSSESHRPENLQRKAKLLIMQDEVCKRYKQYQQQIQMVVTSFESVASLSSATPYASLALTMITKHFRLLKNAITDQLNSIKNASASANASVLKFFEHRKGLEGQHSWRPQRGLPERAVSVLRAWLFDHFLHPYPTDTDKHTLATQTGLTRNQVSNWFINARVRVWKPMVEEIHMLETKASDNAGNGSDGKTVVEDCDEARESSQLRMRAIPDKKVECSGFDPSEQEGDRSKASMWSQEKRSRIEYHVPGSVDGSLMGFVPSHRNGVGSVSLTLGLRQSPEGGRERHMRHYGGQIIGDFVG
ncbi:hypothetical protein SASPL_103475 [Salvia splendens]|uniref:Homeobox domain-containing protein n=1 Tax=Salvia splendens TaxID=180675 RepID=A0A8X8YFV2_SALSN|nr:BEL1-like homeodomain protein 8 [Salvia splendens]XP_042035204.1 BEL1-like homeodomain protein 8 [Salvia splendens]XP_042035208.1 BEL1-like homeodomain protein 8 [Salvia splendens]KAG6431903.1 hypothetical protein SASPL_103475 [Salvia splendens]